MQDKGSKSYLFSIVLVAVIGGLLFEYDTAVISGAESGLHAEIFPNTIRGTATAIAVAFQWIFNFIVSSSFVPMYNLSLGSIGTNFGHAFTYGLYCLVCIVAAVFVYKLVPETKGKTLEDMTKLWKKS